MKLQREGGSVKEGSFSQKTTVVPGPCEIIRSANLSKTSPTGFSAEPKGTSKTTRKTNKNTQFLVLVQGNFLVASVVKNLPSSTGDTGWITGWGTGIPPASNQAHAATTGTTHHNQRSPCAATKAQRRP